MSNFERFANLVSERLRPPKLGLNIEISRGRGELKRRASVGERRGGESGGVSSDSGADGSFIQSTDHLSRSIDPMAKIDVSS